MTSIRAVLASLLLALFAAQPAPAQAPAGPAPALRGMDLVSYFQPGGPVKGQAAFRHEFDGLRYLFSNLQNRDAFTVNPDRYLPQFAGLCTSGLSKGFIGESDPNVWKIVDGKLYLFSTAERMPADAQTPETIARANGHWAKRK